MSDDLDYIRIINSQLRYYLHIPDPEALSDEKWAELWQDLIYIRQQEAAKFQ